MNGTPSFDLLQYVDIETGHLTGAIKDNLTQLYDRISTYQNANVKQNSAEDVDSITPDNNYIANEEALVQWNLPTLCEVGSQFTVTNINSGGWEILMGAGQEIIYNGFFGSSNLAGSGIGTCATLMCVAPNLTFLVISHEGTLTIT